MSQGQQGKYNTATLLCSFCCEEAKKKEKGTSFSRLINQLLSQSSSHTHNMLPWIILDISPHIISLQMAPCPTFWKLTNKKKKPDADFLLLSGIESEWAVIQKLSLYN